MRAFRAWVMETDTKRQGGHLASRPRAVSQVTSQNRGWESPELENGDSSPPNSHSTSEMYVSELEKDMQRFKNEIDMFQVELLALEKEKI